MYKIVCSEPSKGIERSLPYQLKSEEVINKICSELNRMFGGMGYEHRVEPVQAVPQKFERKGKKYAR